QQVDGGPAGGREAGGRGEDLLGPRREVDGDEDLAHRFGRRRVSHQSSVRTLAPASTLEDRPHPVAGPEAGPAQRSRDTSAAARASVTASSHPSTSTTSPPA